MTAVTSYWNRLSIPSRVLLVSLPIVLVLGAVATVALVVLLPPLLDFLGANVDLVRFLVAATAVIVLTIPTAFVIILLELKVIAAMNLRIGPDRVGPWGLAMSVVHGLKVLSKEDYTPRGADVPIFTVAPVAVFLATIMAFLVIPFAPGLVAQDFNIALLYFFAIGGLNIVGLMMAGWASFNKYSLLGALRAAAQAISYEIPLTLSVVGIIILAGTMSLNSIVEQQAGSFLDWNVWKQPLGLIIFFIAAIAEANRTPLDMTEADQEIVAGFATEYSGMRFGFFFFAEYVNVFVVSAMTVVLFFGGWNAPFDWPFPVAGPRSGELRHRAPLRRRAGAGGRDARPGDPLLAGLVEDLGPPGPGPGLHPVQRARRHGVPRLGLHQLRLGRGPRLDDGQDLRLRPGLRPDAGHLPARPRRPADGLRLEVAAAGVAHQHLRDRDRGLDPGEPVRAGR